MLEAWSQTLLKPGAHDTTPSLFEHPREEENPPVKLIALLTVDDVGHTQPGTVDPPPEGDTTVLSTKPKVEIPKDLSTGQATSPIEVVLKLFPPQHWWSS